MAIAYVDCGKRLTGYDPISWRETIADVIASGSVSHAALAAELNRREIEAARGGRWYPTGVACLDRLEAWPAEKRAQILLAVIDGAQRFPP